MKKMIVCDLSQIEPRVLAWIVKDKVMLESMAAGQSPYEAHARATMKWTGGLLKKGNKDLYALAKARVLGLGFGCGWRKFITVAQAMAGLDITQDDPEFSPVLSPDGNPIFDKFGQPKIESGYGFNSKRIVKEFRDSNPLIASRDKDAPGIWKRLDDDFRNSVGEDFDLTLPSGRTLRYYDVSEEYKFIEDEENPGKMKRKLVYTALAFDQRRNSVIRKPFYGGLLTENLVQATARDVFAGLLLDLSRTPGIEVLFHVHDEAVCEVDQNISVKDVETIMGRTPVWLPGCPIAAEGKEVSHYEK